MAQRFLAASASAAVAGVATTYIWTSERTVTKIDPFYRKQKTFSYNKS